MTGYWIVAGLMAIGALAFWHKMKIWSITLIGINLILATLFAVGMFEMVANILDGFMAATAFYNDMIAFSLLFIVMLAILMIATSMISKVDLHFMNKTDAISKWIASLLIVVGLALTTTFVFFEVMPGKPKDKLANPLKVVDFISNGSLSPLLSDSRWNSVQFVKDQALRDAAVYTQTVNNGNSGWKFEGDTSPNAE